MNQNWFPQLPAWMRQQQAPNPFQGVVTGQQQGGFNPGNAFGPGHPGANFNPYGGQELPSIQRYNRLAPSEKQGLSGFYADQVGVNPQDVMFQMDKLRPQQSFGRGVPRWVG